MSDRTKLVTFLVLIFTLLVAVCVNNFVHYYALKDYELYTFVACDPDVHSCFKTDPEFSGFFFHEWPYSKVSIMARHAPVCLDEHNCETFTCEGLGSSCSITYCSEEVLEPGEVCLGTKVNQ